MSRPDLTALELLVRIGAGQSMGAAARALGIAQPNASRTLARLERSLGLDLVERRTSGSRLTDQGALVAHWAADVVEALHRLEVGAQSLATHVRDRLQVAASLTIAEYLAPRWIATLRREHPAARVNLDVHNSATVIAAVLGGAVPLGFVESPQVPDEVASWVLRTDELTVVVHPGHPWATRADPVEPNELAAVAVVVREAGSGTRQTYEESLARAGHTPAPYDAVLASTGSVRSAALAGPAPAVLSGLAVGADLAAGDLVAVPLAEPISRPLRAIWLPEQPPTGLAAELLRCVQPSSS